MWLENIHRQRDGKGQKILKPAPHGYHFPHLVKRAFLRELLTGKRPSREEIENEEIAWNNDLDNVWHDYHYLRDISEFEKETFMLGGKS